MKKRMMAMMLAVMLCVTGVFYQGFDSKAEEKDEVIRIENDLTRALKENTDVANAPVGRGVYLLEGNSFLNKISSTKMGCGGNTVAASKCLVRVTCIVERYEGGGWARVTSWTNTIESGFSATISKTLSVANGYYYRVRSQHYAATDVSSSCTSSLWM